MSEFRFAHSGMLAAAQWLLRNEGQTLQNVLKENEVNGCTELVGIVLSLEKLLDFS